MRTELRRMFDEVLASLDVRSQMAPVLAEQLPADQPLLVIGFGKAARPMATALVELLPKHTMRGLIVPPESEALRDVPGPFEVIAGGHPLPTAGSLQAAARALTLAQSATPDETVVFLVSGGGSAMLEAPADPAVTIAELQRLNQAMLGCGATIDEINTIRRHLSSVKGGRLAKAAATARRQVTLGISDVPLSSPPTALASGPTVPDTTTIAECRDVLQRYQLEGAVPPALQRRLQANDLPEPLTASDALAKQQLEFIVLLDERTARSTATRAAERCGYLVDNTVDVDNLPYATAAEQLLQRLEALHVAHPGQRVAIVTTGEVTVRLPSHPGIGGRNSQFAVHCAPLIENQPIAVLSCGTDGIDGNAPSAGGIVDGTTLARANASGLDVADHLARCDAHTLLEALDDTVLTGPTGTNVRDVRVLVREA